MSSLTLISKGSTFAGALDPRWMFQRASSPRLGFEIGFICVTSTADFWSDLLVNP